MLFGLLNLCPQETGIYARPSLLFPSLTHLYSPCENSRTKLRTVLSKLYKTSNQRTLSKIKKNVAHFFYQAMLAQGSPPQRLTEALLAVSWPGALPVS